MGTVLKRTWVGVALISNPTRTRTDALPGPVRGTIRSMKGTPEYEYGSTGTGNSRNGGQTVLPTKSGALVHRV